MRAGKHFLPIKAKAFGMMPDSLPKVGAIVEGT
jgi:hypothetical protein